LIRRLIVRNDHWLDYKCDVKEYIATKSVDNGLDMDVDDGRSIISQGACYRDLNEDLERYRRDGWILYEVER
jgi:hypothetical protein